MIGVFDSGIGGLTVVRALRKKLPQAHILYVGDVARMPYGNKSAATVTEYAREITRYLVGRGAKMVVIACNTASAVAAEALRQEFSIPILDVISPAVREARRQTGRGKNKKAIAILGTRGTIGSGAYQRALRGNKLLTQACPLFVPLVEEGFAGTPEGQAIISKTLKSLREKKIGSAILGCTHYPILAREIKRVLPGVVLIDSSAVAEDVAALAAVDPQIVSGAGSRLEIVVTDRTVHFEKFARKILGGRARMKTITPEQLSA